MTNTVINTDLHANFEFAATGDTLIVLADGDVDPFASNSNPNLNAIIGLGNCTVTILGTVIGLDGFVDAGPGADDQDIINIGVNGSLIGNQDGLEANDENSITNMGLIASDDSYAVQAGVDNKITNGGHIEGALSAISDGGGDAIVNSGTMSVSTASTNAVIYESGGGNKITNSGLISGSDNYASVDLEGGTNIVTNTGTIEGAEYGVRFLDSGDYLSNSGTISASDEAIQINGGEGGTTIDNSGLIETNADHAIAIGFLDSGYNDSVTNSGKIVGSVDFAGRLATMVNLGTIEGGEYGVFFLAGDSYLSNSGTISASNDAIQTEGSRGETVIKNFGLIETNSEIANAINFIDSGGSDSVTNLGKIIGSIDFASVLATLNNSGSIDGNVSMSAGLAVVRNSGDITGIIEFSGDNNAYYGATGTVEGTVEVSGMTGVYIGGAQGTTFEVNSGTITSGDTIVGGASADDTLDFDSFSNINKTITARDLKHVRGFETIGLGGAETIIVTEQLADTAAEHSLTVTASGDDVVNLANVTSKTDAIEVWGGANSTIIAGVSADTFGYTSADQSTGNAYDTIKGINFAHDDFDLSAAADGNILAINAAVIKGALNSGANFDANLAAALSPKQLGAHDAVLFTASSGTLAHHEFLVVNCDGLGGYQTGSDLAFDITGATGKLTLANFV